MIRIIFRRCNQDTNRMTAFKAENVPNPKKIFLYRLGEIKFIFLDYNGYDSISRESGQD